MWSANLVTRACKNQIIDVYVTQCKHGCQTKYKVNFNRCCAARADCRMQCGRSEVTTHEWIIYFRSTRTTYSVEIHCSTSSWWRFWIGTRMQCICFATISFVYVYFGILSANWHIFVYLMSWILIRSFTWETRSGANILQQGQTFHTRKNYGSDWKIQIATEGMCALCVCLERKLIV